MKTKLIYILTSIYFLLISIPAIAQADTGDDPDSTVPIDDYIWVLVLVAVVFAILKLKAYTKQAAATTK